MTGRSESCLPLSQLAQAAAKRLEAQTAVSESGGSRLATSDILTNRAPGTLRGPSLQWHIQRMVGYAW